MLVPLDSGQVFIDVRGNRDAPVLLYIHGGPGQGSYEFMAAQGDRLARTLRVVGLDQRGVLRSDPIAAGQSLSLDQLAADCASLRRRLNIERWTVLAHSIGALVAIRYAVADPEHVSRLILDCPCLDVGDTSLNLLSRGESMLREVGRDSLADAAAQAQTISDVAARWDALMHVWEDLGDVHPGLYFSQPAAAQWFDHLWDRAPITTEQRRHRRAHTAALQADPAFYRSAIPMLTTLTQPALLLKGAHDPVCTPGQVTAFEDHVADQQVVVLPDSAHFPQIEQPEAYTAHVSCFAETA